MNGSARLVQAVVAAALFGCGGGSSPGSATASVSGTINGRSFDAKDAIATQATGSGFSFGGPATYVEITDYAGACAEETARLQPASGQRLVLGLASYSSGGQAAPPTAVGIFTVHQSGPGAASSNIAQLYYDGGCQKAQAHAGLSGTVTLTSVLADGSLQGTFDIVLTCDGFSTCSGPDAHLTGSFHVTSCAGLNVNATPACG
jgi:hypothetical protein